MDNAIGACSSEDAFSGADGRERSREQPPGNGAAATFPVCPLPVSVTDVAAPAKTLVLGLGNLLLGDEGAGVHAVRRLAAEHPTLPDLEFVDAGTLSFALATLLDDVDQLIVLDAAEMHEPPGTVRLFLDEETDPFFHVQRRGTAHEVRLIDLLAMSRLTGRPPRRRALIGIQPQSFALSTAPTAEVAQAIPRACAMVTDLIERWRA